jgi:hypothetical protein
LFGTRLIDTDDPGVTVLTAEELYMQHIGKDDIRRELGLSTE